MIALWIVIGIVVLLALFLWVTYNGLVTLKVRVDEAWSDITVQMKRRADLIPNLVNTVKGYAKHESGVFEKVTEARAAVVGASSPKEAAKADNMLTDALKRVRPTPQQVWLGRAERATNVQGAFRVAREDRDDVRGRRLVLVDDVLTSGATVDTCARALLHAGAASVDVIVFTRVVESDRAPI